MTYVEYLRLRFKDLKSFDLAVIQVKAEIMKRQACTKYLGESYQTAINQILVTKDMVYVKQFANVKRKLYEQKRIY